MNQGGIYPTEYNQQTIWVNGYFILRIAVIPGLIWKARMIYHTRKILNMFVLIVQKISLSD